MAYIPYNPNPSGKNVGDCVIRAICKLTDSNWDTIYIDVCMQGYKMYDMPSSNSVWSAYLKEQGYEPFLLPNTCPDCYTVEDFCEDYPTGKYMLSTGTHVIAVEDGNYYDSWDSGRENPVHAWFKKEN